MLRKVDACVFSWNSRQSILILLLLCRIIPWNFKGLYEDLHIISSKIFEEYTFYETSSKYPSGSGEHLIDEHPDGLDNIEGPNLNSPPPSAGRRWEVGY